MKHLTPVLNPLRDFLVLKTVLEKSREKYKDKKKKGGGGEGREAQGEEQSEGVRGLFYIKDMIRHFM